MPSLQSAAFPRERRSLNRGWEFQLGPTVKELADGAPGQPGPQWEPVNLPHFGRLEAYDVSMHFQGLCWYRIVLHPEPAFSGKRVTVEFEGAMQVAEVRVNDRPVLTHEGGYLPFVIDVTGALKAGAATLLLQLDNRDNPLVPPGKPLDGMDFCYFTGLYRNAWLDVTDPVHITHPNQASQVAGGGVFVRYENVTTEAADVHAQADVVNESGADASAAVEFDLVNASGAVVAQGSTAAREIASGDWHRFDLTLHVENPSLWSPGHPALYRLTARVRRGGAVCDAVAQRIGIRTLRTDPKDGFFVNGIPSQPFGANRHQAYPYIGNALSDNAQYRDAYKLKAAGWDIIRLSHYPHANAFLDACDELGLMVLICIPGWQFFNRDPRFHANVLKDMRETIRRDRNHPCAVLWETSLNETDGADDILDALNLAAREEYPGDQMLTCGDTEGHEGAHFSYDVPFSGWDGATRSRPNRAGKMSLHREYGDNQFGGYSRYARGDGELLMLVQAWNFQTAVNAHLAYDYTWGQCTWEAFDNNRGFATEIATCGALDPFRLPKYLYYFFQSQRDPSAQSGFPDSGPMAAIANEWRGDTAGLVPLVVFSNCDEVEVIVNGESRARHAPDQGEDVPFGDHSGFDLNYWKGGASVPFDQRNRDVKSPVFTGGNCRNLKHPPFTFPEVAFEPGEVTAIGYLDGRPVVRSTRYTPLAPSRLALRVDLSGRALAADGADAVFVYADIVDEHGIVVPDSGASVTFAAQGEAALIGQNPAPVEAGTASILLRAGITPGNVEITASAQGLSGAALSLPIQGQSRDDGYTP